MTWRPYRKYRESEVEWLGEVPEHWEVKPLRTTATVSYGLGQPPSDQIEGGTPFIRATDIDQGQVLRDGVVLIDAKKVPAGRDAFLKAGDVIVVRSGALTGDSAIIPRELAGAVAGFDMVVRVRRDASSPDFFAWQLLSPHVRDYQFQLLRMRAAQPHLNASELRSTTVCVPKLPEQECIAAFLDRETAKIDTLIAKQERLIELLQEKRQALISHAVTKGLNLDAPMKPSGIEWLGEVPAHWEVKRLKYTVPSITVGIVVTPAKYYVDDGIPCLRSLNISSKVIDTTDLVYISPESNELLRKSQIRAGDVVVVRTGQTGTAAVVPADLDGVNCIDLLIIRRSDSMIPEYLCHFLNAEHTIAQVAAVSEGAIQSHYNTSTLSELRVCAPPIGEQFEILNFLRQRTESIDALLNRTLAAIALMREHRTALISAAVTGKIDVREAHQAAHA